MPLHRQRIAPKKINKSMSLVNLNYNRMPSLFVSLVAILIVAGGTIWLISSNLSTKPAPQVAAVREKRDGSIDVDPSNAKVEEQLKNQENLTAETAPAQPAVDTIKTEPPVEIKPVAETLVRIPVSTKADQNINILALDCSVSYSKIAPEGLKPVVESTAFWTPNVDCKNPDLKTIQIISSKSKPVYPGVQIESLDQDTEYALFYWRNPDFKFKISLDDYLVPLTRFLSNGKLYFNVKDAADKLQLSNKDIYYLAGNCNGEGTGACVLWGLPANGSLVSLLTDRGLANTAAGQENNLLKNQSLRFAKLQDRNNRLALVLQKSTDKIQLIYVDATKNYSIDEVRSYDKDTVGYTKYFR